MLWCTAMKILTMNKMLFTLCLWMGACSVQGQSISTAYLIKIDQVSNQYNQQMKAFLRSLDPQTTAFSATQKQQFCGIVAQYVDGFYQATTTYRAELPPSYAQMSKADVVDKVMQSKEMQLLEKYHLKCDL